MKINEATGVPVPVYLWGCHAEELSKGIKDNTDIFHLLVTDEIK